MLTIELGHNAFLGIFIFYVVKDLFQTHLHSDFYHALFLFIVKRKIQTKYILLVA